MRCRQLLVFGEVIAFWLLTGCTAPDKSVGPDNFPKLPRREAFENCTLDATQCALIQDGITYLKEHANPICRIAGFSAQNRYDAVSGEGFRDQPQYTGLDMSVYMYPPGNPNYPSDQYTNVYPSFWSGTHTNATDAGALIAHEEVHHVGGSEPGALSTQNACLNSQG